MFSLLTSTVHVAGKSMGFWERVLPPEDISKHGHLIDWLFDYTTALNLIFFILVCAGIFGFSFLYNKKRNPKPYYTYGNKKQHIWVATIIGILVFVVIDMNITRISNNDYTSVFINWPKPEEDTVKVQVMAQQWAWNIRYAGKDGNFNTADDVITLNDLRIPINKKVVMQFISKDVIHSFFLPNVRQKVDAIPGRITRMWFEVTKTGVFPIACAEMCGTHHYKMGAKMTVYNESDFGSWMNSAQSMAIQTNDSENSNNFWGWNWK